MSEKFKGEIQSKEQREFEKRKEYGRNITIHAIFMRHGEKEVSTVTPDTGLSKRGRKESEKFGKGLEKERQ